MKKIRLIQIIEISAISILMILIVIVIIFQVVTKNNSDSNISSISQSEDLSKPAIPSVNEANNQTIANPAKDIVSNITNFESNNSINVDEGINSVLMIDHIKNKSAVVTNFYPFTEQTRQTSIVDVFGLFSEPSFASGNNQFSIESWTSADSVSFELNKIINSKPSSSQYLNMSLHLPSAPTVKSYFQGDYVLYETDLSTAVVQHLSNQQFASTVVINKPSLTTSLIFILDYPPSHHVKINTDNSISFISNQTPNQLPDWIIQPATIIDRRSQTSIPNLVLSSDQKSMTYQLDPEFMQTADYPIIFTLIIN